jgi:hypothetical protein
MSNAPVQFQAPKAGPVQFQAAPVQFQAAPSYACDARRGCVPNDGPTLGQFQGLQRAVNDFAEARLLPQLAVDVDGRIGPATLQSVQYIAANFSVGRAPPATQDQLAMDAPTWAALISTLVGRPANFVPTPAHRPSGVSTSAPPATAADNAAAAKSKSNLWWWILGVVVVLGAGGTAYYFATRKKGKGKAAHHSPAYAGADDDDDDDYEDADEDFIDVD